MSKPKLRAAIAAEAARLMLRGTESDYVAARKRAARWLSRRKVDADDLPTNAEIQSQVYALAGLFADEHEGDHPDTLPALRILLAGLNGFRLDPELHPEGDALYHTLQVFELGRIERPYDEEFLLACLLHDVGLSIDRRNATEAALAALDDLVTERTLFLIQHRAAVLDYLSTGEISRSLRRSEHFDDLLLLARCDRDGRVPGADVPELDAALEYIAALSTAWDDA